MAGHPASQPLGPGVRALLAELLTALDVPGPEIEGNAKHVAGMLRALAQLGPDATDHDAITIACLLSDSLSVVRCVPAGQVTR